MATVSTSLKMFDEMTKPLQQITQALNLTISAMDSLSSSSSRDIGITNTLNAARHSTNRASAALHQLAISQNEAANEQENLNDSIDKSSNFIEKLTEKLRDKFESFKEEYLTIEKAFDLTIGGAARLEQQINTVSSALGNKGAGKQFFKGLTDHANQSAYSLEEFTGISMEFMKVTKDTDKLMNLNKSAEKLSLVDPTQGLEGSASAIKEALAGDYGALMDNFGLEGADQEFLESSSGIDDFINKFDEILNAKGATEQALEEVNNSAIAQLDNLKSNIQTSFAEAGYGALEILKPILSTLNEAFQQGRFQPFFDVISNGLLIISTIAKGVADVFGWIGEVVSNNWEFIGPLVWGIVAALIAYNIAMGIAWLATIKTTIAKGIHAIASGIETFAIVALIIAQDGLNAALAACPITWIIIAIIMLIAVFYAVVGAINHFAGTSLSATGMIAGAFMTVLAFIGNLFVGVINFVIQMGVVLWNNILTFAEFFANIFNDPIGSIVRLFGGMADSILGILEGIASAIDAVFGSNLAEAVNGWRGGLKGLVKDLVGEAEIKFDRKDANALKLDRFEYGEAFDLGDKFGRNIEDKFDIGNLFDSIGKVPYGPPEPPTNIMDNLNNNKVGNSEGGGGLGSPGNLGDLGKGITGANDHLKNIDDKMDVSNEHLEMMRDLAEQESVQNFVTLTPTVQVTTGDIKEEADINTIISRIETYMENELVNSAEGVYA
ncbi:putative membrane protein [Clostridium argentinense CDC 2741]|uniref:Putative membrane protein n=1 Tax=Clostridium argentinense CDC 2741 TaxID=1418104 RepID=A0A0C1R2F8_9CLOT|nr:hypothetical protein [Clostridium argentinense]ARC84537.1 hypothetical protein RSJ17_08335 [Clostridium argentinense]KIE47667.1 putative membrane protein [Clostridium argentinense CDC 2741]NFF38679.1 hypothetical protein [Clostridium argentinense]NFP48904.1 hypothetical protein [Clostridium argentinense]NFP72946.1 hypothetical protein [Clostridium argentinense]